MVLTDDQAQQVLDELSGRMAIAQVKNPLRYCATLIERMRRGEFLPELGLKVGEARQAEVAQIEKVSATTPRSEPREIPIQARETFERLRSSSRARSKNGA